MRPGVKDGNSGRRTSALKRRSESSERTSWYPVTSQQEEPSSSAARVTVPARAASV